MMDDDDALAETVNRGVTRILLPRMDTAPLLRWCDARKISAETAAAFGVFVTVAPFPPRGEGRPALAFPYHYKGALVGHVFRDQSGRRVPEPEMRASVFNIDAIETPDVVLIAGDEADVLAAYEAGYRQVVCLRDDTDQELDQVLREYHETFEPVARFTLATPGGDGAPREFRERLARRLGRHRCWQVHWPDGCLTLADTLRAHGVPTVQARIETAEAYPLAGVQVIKPGTLLSHRRRPPQPTLTTGTGASDKVFRFPGEGRLIVITGYPNQGKSTWATFVMMHLAAQHGRRFAVFSPEMLPWEDYAARCAEIWSGQSFRGTPTLAAMTDEDIARAEEFLAQHIVMLVPDSEDVAPTLDWVLGRVREAVLRYGVTDYLIDPWNELSFDRNGESETDHIGRSLQRQRSFCHRHGVNGWIVAHPAKPPQPRPGEKIEAPSLLSISGSQHWANKADLGFSVHAGTIHVVKSRFRRWGKRGAKVMLDFDEATGRFSTPVAQQRADDEGEPNP